MVVGLEYLPAVLRDIDWVWDAVYCGSQAAALLTENDYFSHIAKKFSGIE